MVARNVSLENKTVLVTGAAGFIGANLVKRLLKEITGIRVIGIDNVNDYYDVSLKESRLAELTGQRYFICFCKGKYRGQGTDRIRLRRVRAAGSGESGSTGGCALLHHESGCVHRSKPDRIL